MTTTELNLTATYVTALATQPDANEKIKMLLQSLFSSYEKKDRFSVQQTEKKNISSIITFSQKEISNMDKTFLITILFRFTSVGINRFSF